MYVPDIPDIVPEAWPHMVTVVTMSRLLGSDTKILPPRVSL